MKAFEITAILDRGAIISYPWPLPLDGLVAAAVMKQAGRSTALAADPAHPIEELDLPLKKHADGFYYASCVLTAENEVLRRPTETETEWLVKPPPTHKMLTHASDSETKNVSFHKGTYRPTRTPYRRTLTRSLRWRGYGQELETLNLLAAHIRHLGKNRHRTTAAVKEWRLEPFTENADWTLWSPTKRPLRPMPPTTEWAGGISEAPLTSPYWRRDRATQVMI